MLMLFALQCIFAVIFIFLGIRFLHDALRSELSIDIPEIMLSGFIAFTGVILGISAYVTWGLL